MLNEGESFFLHQIKIKDNQELIEKIHRLENKMIWVILFSHDSVFGENVLKISHDIKTELPVLQ